jgi:hypothetical protein
MTTMRKYLPSKDTAKAVVSAAVVAAAYLVGVIPAEGSFGDVSTVQWLGLVVFMGGAYGITYATPDSASPVRRLRHRVYEATEADWEAYAESERNDGDRGHVDLATVLLVGILVILVLVLFGFLR